MKLNWFIRKGIFFFPHSIIGWSIFAAAIGCAIYLFIDIDRRSHSASDTLMNWAFNCLILAVAYSLIGFFTEKKQIDSL